MIRQRLSALRIALLCILGSPAFADAVVLDDGTVLRGDATKTETDVAIGGTSVPLDKVLLWENADGVAQHARDDRAHYRGCVALAEETIRKQCEERLVRALEANDSDTARRLLDRAERAGLDMQQAEHWDRKIDAAGDAKSDVKVPGDDVLADLLLDRAKKNEGQRGLALLRGALRLDDKHEASLAYLAELAPKSWKIGDARTWLDWQLEVLPGVRLHKPRRRGGNPELNRAITFWGRRDLVGLETDNMIFITPLENPLPVSMCIELSDLTCAALDEMFKIEEPKREEFLPLVVYFYENKEEYVQLSNRGMGGGPSATLGLTAGHYTPNENISRFFWPKQRDAYRSVRDTFVHELTHHWIERRNPRWHARDLAGLGERVQIPGYWVVEGFATFIQHSRFDRSKKTWTHFNPHAHSIDVVAAVAKSKKLLDWEMVYTLPQSKFHGELAQTATKAHCRVDGRWIVRPIPISAIRLFYEQSSATCMYLYWGDGGRYRNKLLDYVTAFYTSDKEGTDLSKAFGLKPNELGAKVASWCTDVIHKGWRPK